MSCITSETSLETDVHRTAAIVNGALLRHRESVPSLAFVRHKFDAFEHSNIVLLSVSKGIENTKALRICSCLQMLRTKLFDVGTASSRPAPARSRNLFHGNRRRWLILCESRVFELVGSASEGVERGDEKIEQIRHKSNTPETFRPFEGCLWARSRRRKY